MEFLVIRLSKSESSLVYSKIIMQDAKLAALNEKDRHMFPCGGLF